MLAAGTLAIFTFTSDAWGSIVDISGVVRTGDFDGDKIFETVVSSPETNCGKGAVYIVTADGVLTTWTRETPGVLGDAACDDLFGASLAVGDFDGDGYDDLAIAAPGANDTGQAASGSVHVLHGSALGLTAAGDQLWTLNTPNIQGVAKADDHWGDSLAAGDFNCDGNDDLAIGGPRRKNDGVSVIYGSAGGLSSVGDQMLPGSGGGFGAALAAGNFDGNVVSDIGCDDLIIAAPYKKVSGVNAGILRRFAGGIAGLEYPAAQTIHQDSPDVVDTAEVDDLFGWRLAMVRLNSDSYDDLFVAVPGDACTASVGTGRHTFYGSASGITMAGNAIACDTYACSVFEERILACHSGSPPVYGTATSEVISTGMSTGVVWGGGGDDAVYGDHGDDVLFGGAGNDLLAGGPGRDMIIAGSGDDTIVIDLDCMVVEGEVVDGGPGNDTVRSHRTQAQLQALGLTLVSIEQFLAIDEDPHGASFCDSPPADDGPYLRPRVNASWSGLATPDSVLSTSTGILTLELENKSPDVVAVDVEFALWVRGEELRLEQGPTTIAAGGSEVVTLDLHDFIPLEINPGEVNPALLVLPVSASITTRARLSVFSEHVGYSFAPTIFGHLESGGNDTSAVLYREGALHDTYHHGDLARWRANAAPYTGTAKLMGRIEAHGSLGIPGY